MFTAQMSPLWFQRPSVDDGGGRTNENIVDLRGTFAHHPVGLTGDSVT